MARIGHQGVQAKSGRRLRAGTAHLPPLGRLVAKQLAPRMWAVVHVTNPVGGDGVTLMQGANRRKEKIELKSTRVGALKVGGAAALFFRPLTV